jgi:CheY-like chemotaxis protein
MSFFAVLFALLLEQLKPLPRDNWIHDQLVAWVGWTGRNFDAGKAHHAWVVWIVSVLLPCVLVAGAFIAISRFSLLLALAFNIAMLYLTLGFRQFSHYFTDIRDALDRGDENLARQRLAEWRHLDASELPRTEVLRHVLMAAGATVTTAHSVQEGLSAIQASPPDIILTDLAMPGESGLSLIQRVRSGGGDLAHLPIIVLSACAFEGDREAALDAGASVFLPKPFKPAEVVKNVRQLTLSFAMRGRA